MDKYIVAFFDTHNTWGVKGPVEVHVMKGHSVKDTMDRIAESVAEKPHIIYFVCLESDFRQYYRDIVDNYFGK